MICLRATVSDRKKKQVRKDMHQKEKKKKTSYSESFESFSGVQSALKRHPMQVIQEILENGIEI